MESKAQNTYKKVLILTQYFYPDVAATGRVLTELAEDLAKFGRKVKVITGQPSYDKKTKKALHEEFYKGIEIKRIWFWRFSKDNKIGRALNYTSFFIGTFLNLFFERNYHSLLIVSNPPILPLIGVIIKKIKRCNSVYLVHDIYPDIAIKIGAIKQKSLTARFLNLVNNKAFKSVDTIVVLGQDTKRILLKKGVSESKIKIITNWANEVNYDYNKKTSNIFEIDSHKFVLLYTGNLGLCHGLEIFIEAAEKLRDYENILFIFVGEGGKKQFLKKEVEKRGLKNILFFPYYPEEMYPQVLTSGDILLVSLAKGLEGLSVPSKTYSYLASGKAVGAVVTLKSDIGKLIEENKCGFRVDPGDVDEFCKKVIQFYKNPDLIKTCSQNSFGLFKKNFRRSRVTKKYLEIL